MSIVAVALGSLASATAIADDMFLKFTGGTPPILGSSTDTAHPGEIEVLSYSLGVEADTSWTKGGGASVGKPNPGDFRFTAAMNRSVPTIFQYITTGKAAPGATLTVRTVPPGHQAGFEYAKYTFEGVFFTAVEQGLAGDAAATAAMSKAEKVVAGKVAAIVAVSAVYKTVKIQQFTPGNPVGVSCVLWDVPAGTSGPC